MTTTKNKTNKINTTTTAGTPIRLGNMTITRFTHVKDDKARHNNAVQHSYKKEDKEWVNSTIYLSDKNLNDIETLIQRIKLNKIA